MLEIMISIGVAAVALVYALILTKVIKKKPAGSKKMADVAKAISEGAKAYLNKQYITLFAIAGIVFIVLLYSLGPKTALGFLLGAIFSVLAGYIGMRTAVVANVRTTEAAKSGIFQALNIALKSGSVMSFMVVGLGLLASAGYYAIFRDTNALLGLGFGGSFVALFARVGGGIFTKAADVGADIVGKVEEGIPEDDPRNPASVADNVGDNVGDIAGMGADLYESYVDSIVIAMILGVGLFSADKGIFLPLILAGLGIVASIIGVLSTGIFKRSPRFSLNTGTIASGILVLAGSYLLSRYYINDLKIFYVIAIGLLAGVIIGFVTEYYTSDKGKPTRALAEAAKTGAATNVIFGLALGMISTIIPIIVVVAAILSAYYFLGLFGIALAGVGMLSTLGMTLATDTYGPVADNAAGIAQMAGLDESVRKNAEELDAVGNTTAAVGKGFAIGSAALTSLALFAGYTQAVGINSINLVEPRVISGLFLGALLPFVFSSMTMKAVGEAASRMVREVQRQFREIAGLREGKASADYKRCISISAGAAIYGMILPSTVAILTPLLVGIFLGAESLGGLLAGLVASGFLLALTMANAGGAWDNAKKYIEAGNLGGKGSVAHKAAVVGDTVGDPLKDTSGPSLNILIKLVSIIAILIVPIITRDIGLTAEVIIVIVAVLGVAALMIFRPKTNG
ncbi:sodium-translocating pyrophosphatase [Candidatus Berkelbacteria bacterium RIFOXYA2_FULL_43_10]|uniref:Putative K(+)-stimulated pyrophosphate-energized sodium pump n=1 Tax=Candidatus Berkelbacteria bacterium RIFOXYA2_FULL_43_10 TaxID=1797472 RepID=A0A1F5EDH2_9BACT|nr:MAG: sodium-translocating pyrophosphatase [Candidatus Berkelbacteria bacterium RIFOXYA2_FULL_43_10]